MVKKKDITTNIANLLPEGLDEKLIDNIAKLLSEKIEEEVSKVTEEQTRKTVAFIRGNIDRLKEHALKELELENETFRGAQMFETLRSMFAVELTGNDDLNAITALASMSEQQEQKAEVLVKEVDRLLSENIKLKNSGKVLYQRNQQLDEQLSSLSSEVETLQEQSDGKNLSDSAVIVSSENFKKKTNDKSEEIDSVAERLEEADNEWLNPHVMEALNDLRKRGN